ncbi:MAG TPA: hypothetical protein VK821_05435 [Dehalococcoidia bacterium]|nr:hypothetical protein [Dehalococcoidia bacterium]
MLAPDTLTTHIEEPQSNDSHRAFLSKMERDQKARRASAHRHQMRWFVFDFTWETIDEEALARDLARSERLFMEELQRYATA